MPGKRLIEEITAERDQWREEAWRCYVAATDGEVGDAGSLKPGAAHKAVTKLKRKAPQVEEKPKPGGGNAVEPSNVRRYDPREDTPPIKGPGPKKGRRLGRGRS